MVNIIQFMEAPFRYLAPSLKRQPDYFMIGIGILADPGGRIGYSSLG